MTITDERQQKLHELTATLEFKASLANEDERRAEMNGDTDLAMQARGTARYFAKEAHEIYKKTDKYKELMGEELIN